MSFVRAASRSLAVMSWYTSGKSTVRSGTREAAFSTFPVFLSFIGEIGGMNSDILEMFFITLHFFLSAQVLHAARAWAFFLDFGRS